MKTGFLVYVVVAFATLVAPSATQAALFKAAAVISGPNNPPPNAFPGIGFTSFDIDDTAHTMRIQVTFSGLQSNSTNSHAHAPTAVAGTGTAGVAVGLFPAGNPYGFPIGVTSGTFDFTLNTALDATWSNGYRTASGGTALLAEAAFIQAIKDGKAYYNIHTVNNPGGEIGGFLSPVPEPSSVILMGSGLLAMFLASGFKKVCRRAPKGIA